MEIFHETKIKPIDAEIQKLLDASPPVHIDHSILKIKDSDEYSATGSDPRLGIHGCKLTFCSKIFLIKIYVDTGFAFSSEEKMVHKTPGQQGSPQKNNSKQSNMAKQQSQHQGYANIISSPSQQISNEQSYGSPESSFASPQSHKQNRLNNINNRPKGH